MATYLKFHQLSRSPFEGRESHQLVLATASLRSAHADIRSSLQEDSPRICISGGSGIGKSSFARALPKLLEREAECVLVRYPGRHWGRLESAVARQLALPTGPLSRTSLMTVRKRGRRIVIVIDQAEELLSESLEQLDTVLGYLDDDGKQVVHCVLLANLEAAPRGQELPLRWWLDQLATQRLRFSPIPQEGIRSYIDKHLEKAGCRRGSIFNDPAVKAIHRYTGGVPGAVNVLCEELLSRAAELQQHQVDAELVASVCDDEPPPKPEPEPVLPRSSGAGAANPLAGREPELEIQQGLVHMEAPERLPSFGDHSGDDRFASMQPPLVAPWPRKKPLPPGLRLSPNRGRGRGARVVRNLIGFALLVCLAMMLHLAFFADKPTLPQLLKPLAAPTERLRDASTEPGPEASSAVAKPQPDWNSDSLSQAIPADETPSGLTSDLRLDSSSSHATVLAQPAAEVQDEFETVGDTAPPTTHEETTNDPEEPTVFEPWAEQAPEPATPPQPATAQP